MDETSCYFKTLPEKGLAEKKKKRVKQEDVKRLKLEWAMFSLLTLLERK